MIHATVTITPEAMRELSRILQESMREAMKRQTQKQRTRIIFPREDERTSYMKMLQRIRRECGRSTMVVEVTNHAS